MKIICNCGTVHRFNDYNEYTQQFYIYDKCMGATYNTIEGVTFWQPDHGALGIKCNNCGKAIWIFV